MKRLLLAFLLLVVAWLIGGIVAEYMRPYQKIRCNTGKVG